MGSGCSKSIILTRSREDIEKDRPVFERLEFKVISLPLIKTEPLEFQLPAEEPDYVVFQSVKAVIYFLDKVTLSPAVRIVAVGEKTKKVLEKRGYRVWMMPDDSTAEGIVKAFPSGKGGTVLVPRSEQGRKEVIEGLRRLGYHVIPLNVYRTAFEKHRPEIVESKLAKGRFIFFASPSAVRSLFANLQENRARERLKSLIVVAIGKTTKRELEEMGVSVSLVPSKPLIEEVALEILKYWQRNCLQ